MKILTLSLLTILLLSSPLSAFHANKHPRHSRSLNEEETIEEDVQEEQIDDENPDLEMLEDLEKEATGEGNIFQELLDQKHEMLDRLKLLEDMVNEELMDFSDGEDILKRPISHMDTDGYKPDEPEENWVLVHRNRLIKLFVLGGIFGLILLIGWKLSNISKDVLEKKKAVKMFQKKLEEVDEKEIDSLVASWKDQREGIGKFL
jgi:hypothetical protein